MLERTRKEFEDALFFGEKLLASPKYDPKNLSLDLIPKDFGVYLWRNKTDGTIMWVGRATSRKGLFDRIILQDLSKSSTTAIFKRYVARDQKIDVR